MGALKRQRSSEPLSGADQFALRAAEGWLELNNLSEADAELLQVTRRGKACLDVLLLRWRILAQTGHWEACLGVAKTLTKHYPEEVQSWIRLAESYYKLDQFQKAFRIASTKAAQFPCSSVLLYDAACYCCLVAKFDLAERYFAQAHQASAPASRAASGVEVALCPSRKSERLVSLSKSRLKSNAGSNDRRSTSL